MSNHDPDPEGLRRLETELRKARGRKKAHAEDRPPSKLGIAFRLSTEFVAAPFVGGAIGWGLDYLFGTAPVLLLVMFCLGIAAGFRNLLRAAKEMNTSDNA
jgi:ATP synthase protein I